MIFASRYNYKMMMMMMMANSTISRIEKNEEEEEKKIQNGCVSIMIIIDFFNFNGCH